MNGKKWVVSPINTGSASAEFRKTVNVDKKVKSAKISVSALGVYALYINGKRRLDCGVLTPGFTSYENRIQYQTYDITDALKSKNEINVIGAPGWAVGHLGYKLGRRNIFSDIFSVTAELEIIYVDGTKEKINTDKTWDVYTSKTEFSDIYDGETVNFNHRSKYLGKAKSFSVKGKLVPQVGEFIVERERVAVKEFFTAPNGERIIDFGQNMTGYVEIKIKGKKGERIRLSFAEVLDKYGNFYNSNYRDAKNDIVYVLDGKEHTLKPRFTFEGFRYVRLDEYPDGPVDVDCITAVAVYSDMKRTGYFSCGNEKINQLYSNAIWGQRSNYLDIPTDCPQRDERLGWTGDAQVFCRTAAINYDVRKFFEKWLGDVRLEQEDNGAVHGVVPSPFIDGTYNTRVSAAWGDAATIIPWELYMAYGDKKQLAENFELMRGWVDYMHGAGDEEFLWLGGNHYGDWLAMDAGEDNYTGATATDLIATAFFAHSTDLVIKAGEVLGRDVSEYKALKENVIRAFREYFTDNGIPKTDIPITNTTKSKTTNIIHEINSAMTQTSICLMLHFGLCPEEERPMLADMLCDLIEKFDGRMATGFVGTPYILHTLSENGRSDLAYKLFLKEENPSWLFSVNKGATTIWEHWNGIKENGDFWSDDMNSFNHYAYGSVFDWVFGVVCGIKPIAPGYKKVRIAPQPCEKLGFAEYSIDTVNGKISSKWAYRDGDVRFDISIPCGVDAEIVLPDGTVKNVTGGDYVYTIKA